MITLVTTKNYKNCLIEVYKGKISYKNKNLTYFVYKVKKPQYNYKLRKFVLRDATICDYKGLLDFFKNIK